MVGVVGSNPIAPTKYQNGIKFTGLIPFFFGHVARWSIDRVNKKIPKRYRISKRSDVVCEIHTARRLAPKLLAFTP